MHQITTYHKNRVYHVKILMTHLFAIICLLVLFGCPSNTKPEKGTIAGYINLEQRDSHEGVTVMLFRQDAVSAELVQAVQSYDTIEFTPQFKHMFDHRTSTPVKTTLTNSSGFFEFPDVPYGLYAIAYFKEGFGYNYSFDLILNSSLLNLAATLHLYPEIVLPNMIDTQYVMTSGRTYIVNSNTYCSETSNLILEDGVNLLISPNLKLITSGDFQMSEGTNSVGIRITSSSNIYTNIAPSIGGSIELLPLNGSWQYNGVIASYLYNGLIIKRSNISINSSVFIRNIGGVHYTNVSDVSFNGNLVVDNDQEAIPSVSTQNVNSVVIQRNMFWNNTMSVNMDVTEDGLVSNNHFYNGQIHLQHVYNSDSIVEYNNFINAAKCIDNSALSNMLIRYNEIVGETCIYLGRGNYNYIDQGWTKANYNNLSGSLWAVYSETKFYYPGDFVPLDFTNNFWDTTQASTIDAMIWDHNDAAPSSVGVWAQIVYLPFRSSRVPNAGIQARI